MDWERDLPKWSHSSLSRRIARAPHRWHVQITGDGPDLLMLPGSGSSVHTWRDLIPDLAKTHRVIALDLPGQGFTQTHGGHRSGLDEMTADIADLASSEDWRPEVIVSHSAGTAIALRLTQKLGVIKVVGINPALDNFSGVAGWLFPMLARLLAVNPLTATLFTLSASPARSRNLIQGTGSHLDETGYAFYGRLMRDRDHVNGALNMMARWSLSTLLQDLPAIKADCLFLTGTNDKAVPPSVAEKAAVKVPNARVQVFEGLGHLAHEEDPHAVLAEIHAFIGN